MNSFRIIPFENVHFNLGHLVYFTKCVKFVYVVQYMNRLMLNTVKKIAEMPSHVEDMLMKIKRNLVVSRDTGNVSVIFGIF